MKKLFNLIIVIIAFVFLLTSCQTTTTKTETTTNKNVKNQTTTEQTTTITTTEDLIFDWTDVKSIIINEIEYSPRIFYVTTDENVNLSEIDWDSQNYSNLNHFVNKYESKQDAIKQYENEIGKFYFKRNPGVSGVGEYQKATIIGYELTTYEVKLYKTNYLQIKTIVYNSSDNSTTTSIIGLMSPTSNITFYE